MGVSSSPWKFARSPAAWPAWQWGDQSSASAPHGEAQRFAHPQNALGVRHLEDALLAENLSRREACDARELMRSASERLRACAAAHINQLRRDLALGHELLPRRQRRLWAPQSTRLEDRKLVVADVVRGLRCRLALCDWAGDERNANERIRAHTQAVSPPWARCAPQGNSRPFPWDAMPVPSAAPEHRTSRRTHPAQRRTLSILISCSRISP
jgi:hypothetical protein